jgi:ParB family transcriptional regulator, chromosome partitioning protein
MKAKRSPLGRGLSAILESPETDITSKDISGNYVVGAVATIAIDKIEANPFQPRDRFEEISLQELANSIKQQGIIQPVTVRKLGYDKYQLISGERRIKAARLAGMYDIPCFIRVANDQQMLELALIENIHRKDLNAMEIAISYQRLIEECRMTQDKLSEQIGKDRTTITNYIRLLKLPPEIQIAVREERISMGHARAIISVNGADQQLSLLGEIIRKKLSVREVERLVKEGWFPEKQKTKTQTKPLEEKHLLAKGKLAARFQIPVEISKNNKGKGKIVIPFASETEFDRIMSILDK